MTDYIKALADFIGYSAALCGMVFLIMIAYAYVKDVNEGVACKSDAIPSVITKVQDTYF
jgi:heme/copper-type cytochrome/quinol oxidase subunit 3